jgi:hypothetical protein
MDRRGNALFEQSFSPRLGCLLDYRLHSESGSIHRLKQV